MAAKKSKKPAAKYSYVERVLGAVSDYQKEHRKHSVHQTALRAQIRKTARAKKDKLGPQWISWVGKTIHKLEEEGVLAPADPAGNVALTPNGKKAIATARRDLAIAAHASPTATQEDMIWKHVAHQLASRGTKRRQSAIRQGDEDEEEEVSSTLQPGTPRSKKARRSSAVLQTPLSRMTKAQLLAALESAQSTRTEAPLAPPEASDTDELQRLKLEIAQRQEEIDLIRAELAAAKQATAEIEMQHEDNSWRRTVSPEPQPDFEPATSSPSRPNTANQIPRARTLFEVTRTASGSLISNISKQATPAPSSPGFEHDNLTEDDVRMDEDDVFGPVTGPTIARSDAPGTSERVRSNGLPTPHGTPAGAILNREAALAKEVQTYKTIADELKRVSAEQEKMLTSKVDLLESAVNSHVTSIEVLNKDHDAERARLEATLVAKNAEIVTLQAEVDQERQTIVLRDATLAFKDAHISEIESNKSSLQQESTSQRTRIQELERILEEKMAAMTLLTTEKDSRIAELEKLVQEADRLRVAATEELQAVSAQAISLAESLRAAESRTAGLSDQLKAALDHNAVTEDSRAEAQRKVDALGAQLKASNEELLQIASDKAKLVNDLSVSQSAAEALRAEIASLYIATQLLNEKLSTSGSTIETLRAELAVASQSTAALSTELADQAAVITEVTASRNDALVTVSSLSADTADLRARLLESEKILAATEARLGASREEAAQLSQDVTSKEQQRSDLAAKLVTLEAVRDDLAAGVQARDADIGRLNGTIQTAKQEVQDAEAMLASVRKEKATCEERISALQLSLHSAQEQGLQLNRELESSQAARLSLQQALHERDIELEATQTSLNAEKTRASALHQDLMDTIARAQDAEEEVTAVKQSKAIDERTIESLKAGYARLRQIQLDSLADIERQVTSAHSSPVPITHRRPAMLEQSI
ncbi:hypothetical protein PLICRDRAFT_57656 [Plicaturopsis crispa FD-325 SS-3]|uniref:Unplaced genomic scaffold PLICRscaffold_18, whole genome shotgun sequence n=1 Tax=Plicaturopsis crispa FD-325 SS-3 TaxID=944288 RepID=A0A0C9SXC1_PLICR|nr:hypothetical protein PLICRDRAFT_57656 [Plicaturopsis crispa FD-325 SS-3]